jgi:hypothetical protein
MHAATPQRTAPTHRARRARPRREQGAASAVSRRLRTTTEAVSQSGPIERQLVDPIAGSEGDALAQGRAERTRAGGRGRLEAVTHYLSVGS